MVSSELIPSIRIGDVEVVLDKTPIADVARRFNATRGHRGDASESLDWLCLTGRDTRDRWILWLESGEIHGGAIGAFQLRRLGESEPVDVRCRAVAVNVQDPAALRLEMSRDDVR